MMKKENDTAHLITRNNLTNSDEVDLICQCGWTYRVTDERYARSIEDRHLRLNTDTGIDDG